MLMQEQNPCNLDVVSVRLVKDAPIMSGHPITNPEEFKASILSNAATIMLMHNHQVLLKQARMIF